MAGIDEVMASEPWRRGVTRAVEAMADLPPVDDTVVTVSLDDRGHTTDRGTLVLCRLCHWPRDSARCICAIR